MTDGEACADAEAEGVHWNEEGSWTKEEPGATNEKHEHVVACRPH